MTVNAFHADYIKTHEPDLMKDFRTHQANRDEREEKNLKVNRNPLKTVTKSLSVKISKEQARLDLQRKKQMTISPKLYHTYARAGLPTGVKK
jgi:hypothetical protein